MISLTLKWLEQPTLIETPKLYGYQGESYIEWNNESLELVYKIIVQDEKVPVINIYVPKENSWLENGEQVRLGGILKTQEIYWGKLKKFWLFNSYISSKHRKWIKINTNILEGFIK